MGRRARFSLSGMNYDPTDIQAEARRTRDKAQTQQINREQEVSDFLSLMATPAGRRFVWRLLDKCGVYRTSFKTSAEMAFLEGQRNIGLLLIGELHELCPERYVEMLNEANEAKERRKL